MIYTKKGNAKEPSAVTQLCTVNCVYSGSTHHLGCGKPVRQKLRCLSLSVCEEVSAEFKRLLQTGIIEPVDASEWVSLLVVARKRKRG